MLPITHWFKQFLLLRVFWHRTAVATWLTLWLVSTRGNKVAMWGMGKNNPSAHAAGRLSYKISKQLNWTAGRQKLGTSHNIKGERNREVTERDQNKRVYQTWETTLTQFPTPHSPILSVKPTSHSFIQHVGRRKFCLHPHGLVFPPAGWGPAGVTQVQEAAGQPPTQRLHAEKRGQGQDRSRTYVRPPAVCHDLVKQNPLYPGDGHAVQPFFPWGITSNLIIEPQGGDMHGLSRWEGKPYGLIQILQK